MPAKTHDIPLKHLLRWENSLLRLQFLLTKMEQVGNSTHLSDLPALLEEQAEISKNMPLYESWLITIEAQTPQLSVAYQQKKSSVLVLLAVLAEQAQRLELLFAQRKQEFQELLSHPIAPRRPASALKVATPTGRVNLTL